MTPSITPTQAQDLANRRGVDVHLLGGVPLLDEDVYEWYGGNLPADALTFKPEAICDTPLDRFCFFCPGSADHDTRDCPKLDDDALALDPPDNPDPDPSTGLGSSEDEGDEPPAGRCCVNWTSHAPQDCPVIRAAAGIPPRGSVLPPAPPDRDREFFLMLTLRRAQIALLAREGHDCAAENIAADVLNIVEAWLMPQAIAVAA